MAENDTGSSAGQHTGSILTRKTGPLANWIWMAILLLVALIYSLWKRNKAGAADENVDTTVDDSLDNQTPPPVFILPQNPQPSVIINNGGTTPSAPAGTTKPPVTTKPPIPTAPSKPAVAYDTVKVTKYTTKNPPWNSTLWGIAKHAGYGSAADNFKAILNDPKNAALKKKIGGDPKKLPVGATIYVRRK
jgi:hypothetical protein